MAFGGGAQEVKAARMGFNDFLVRGLVEYVDVNEENNSLIALYEVRYEVALRFWAAAAAAHQFLKCWQYLKRF